MLAILATRRCSRFVALVACRMLRRLFFLSVASGEPESPLTHTYCLGVAHFLLWTLCVVALASGLQLAFPAAASARVVIHINTLTTVCTFVVAAGLVAASFLFAAPALDRVGTTAFARRSRALTAALVRSPPLAVACATAPSVAA